MHKNTFRKFVLKAGSGRMKLSQKKQIERAKRLFKRIILGGLFVIYFLPASLLKIKKIYFPKILVSRIGHLVVEPEMIVKEAFLMNGSNCTYVIVANKLSVANIAIVDYWKKYFIVVTNPILSIFLYPLLIHPFTRLDLYDYAVALDQSSRIPFIQVQWEQRGYSPLLKLSQYHIDRGEEVLRSWGIPKNSWFICFHCREGKYSPRDEFVHEFRSADIQTYLLAADAIVEKGGYCIRIGDSSMKKLPVMKNVIDYPHSPEKSDWLDLYLAASCLFFLGCASGAYNMATVFGTPVACANMSPLSSVFPWGKNDVGMPQLYWSTRLGRLMTFEEVMSSPCSNFRFSTSYKEAGIELIKNSAEEIKDLALEMHAKCLGVFNETREDVHLQARMKSLFRPGHYLYGSSSTVSTLFLRKYSYLL
jgi:putative glycosyltransferase (TIGR04372 family)